MDDIISGIGELGLGLYDRLYADPKKQRENKRRIRNIKGNLESDYSKMRDILDTYHEGQDRFVTPEMKKDYQKMLSGYDPNAFVYDFDKFQFTDDEGNPLTKDNFLVENKDAMLEDIVNTLSHSASGAGLGRGSGAGQAIAQNVADKSLELQKLASQEYQQAKGQAYDEWSDYIDKMQNKMGLQEAGYRQKLGLIGGEMERERGEESDYMADLLNILQGKSANMTQADMALLQ